MAESKSRALAGELAALNKHQSLIEAAMLVEERLRMSGARVAIAHHWDGDCAAVGLQCQAARSATKVLVYLSTWSKPEGTVAVEIEDVSAAPHVVFRMQDVHVVELANFVEGRASQLWAAPA